MPVADFREGAAAGFVAILTTGVNVSVPNADGRVWRVFLGLRELDQTENRTNP